MSPSPTETQGPRQAGTQPIPEQFPTNSTTARPNTDSLTAVADAEDAAAALDARIAELTRRRTEMARRAAGSDAASKIRGPAQGGLGVYAGAAADSFAQAFVDRWASSQNGSREGMGPPGMMEDPAMMMPNEAMMLGKSPEDLSNPKKSDVEGMGGYDPMSVAAGDSRPSSNGMSDMDYARQSSGPMASQLGPQQLSMDSQAAASAAANFRRMNGMPSMGMDMASMGMNYGMPNQAMMGGMPGMPTAAGYDRRNSQMSITSMDGAQAFQNWQQQQMSNFFPMQSRMGMMGTGMMHPGMMQQGMMQGMHPGMMQGMNPMMNPLQEQQAPKPEAKPKTKRRNPSAEPQATPELVEASKGPFKTLDRGIPLSLEEDKDWLTPLHCFVRRSCVEAFTATEEDVQAPSKGKRKPIQPGQVGIRCPHCVPDPDGKEDGEGGRERGSVYYPTSLSSIYNATMNLLQRHIHSCTKVPKHVMDKYTELKQDDARSGTSKRYWVESAKSVGFVDTLKGIRLSADAPPSLCPEVFSSKNDVSKEAFKKKSDDDSEEDEGKKLGGDDDDLNDDESKVKVEPKPIESKPADNNPAFEAPPLVLPSDKDSATAFSFLLLAQMQPCVFTEADRLGKRKGLPTGFAGLACRHCFGGYGSGRFFPSSIKTLSDTSKTLNVLHNHMTRCRKCPQEVIDELAKVKENHDDERAKMKFGSQKALFAKIWSRLHDNRPYDPVAARNTQSSKAAPHDGSMPNPQKTMQYPPGISNNDMAFMAGQMGGPPGQMPMMGGYQMGMGQSMMGGPQHNMNMGMMGGPQNMNMGMMSYQDQFMMGGGFSNMQFGGGGVGNGSGFSQPPTLSNKRDKDGDDSIGPNKRIREI